MSTVSISILSAVGAIEIVVGALAVGLVAFTIIFNIIRRKRGKTGCGCDCSSCHSGCCSSQDNSDNPKT